tara:strand:+ start:1910 stop:2215 length:306 start_codon:yes stop_codon:yes gene_type:complete
MWYKFDNGGNEIVAFARKQDEQCVFIETPKPSAFHTIWDGSRWQLNEYDQWLADIASYDQWVPRTLEETIDAVGTDNFSDFIIEKYNEKKALRAAMPGDSA